MLVRCTEGPAIGSQGRRSPLLKTMDKPIHHNVSGLPPGMEIPNLIFFRGLFVSSNRVT